MDKPPRNPTWSRDELILALALYRTNPANPPGKNSAAVAELSVVMNKMHLIGETMANSVAYDALVPLTRRSD